MASAIKDDDTRLSAANTLPSTGGWKATMSSFCGECTASVPPRNSPSRFYRHA